MGLINIYKIVNTNNGKIYIGKTSKGIDKRFKKHINNAKNKINRRLYDSMNYHGYDKFKIELICLCVTNFHADIMEIYFIKKYYTQDKKFGYNMTSGGDGGVRYNYHYGKSPYDWWVEKYGIYIADDMKKNMYLNLSDKLSKKYSGLSFNDRWDIKADTIKNKISNTLKSKGIKPPVQNWKDKPHPMLNKKHKEESKRKMSLFRKNKTIIELYGEEKASNTKAKMSDNIKGDKNPNYRPPLTKGEKIELLNSIQKNEKLTDISNKLSRSLYELRKYIKSIGIYNIQKQKVNKDFKILLADLINSIN